MVAMAEYGVPAGTLASPHGADAMRWVLLHMTTIGLLAGVVGWGTDGARLQRAYAELMLGLLLVYTTLDVRAADWALVNALHKGPGSLGPVVVDVLTLLAWARLCGVRARPA